jgi:hypothetical protein
MKSKSLLILGAVAIVVAGLGTMAALKSQSRVQTTSAGTGDTGPFFPTLLDNANKVTRVEVADANRTLTVERRGDQWVVTSSAGYPAKLETVRQLIMEVASLRKLEPKTANPALYKQIDVEDPGTEGAKSKSVKLFGEGDSPLASLIVGKQRWGQGGGSNSVTTFVRAAGDNQSWLVQGQVTVDPTPTNWMNSQIFAIPNSRVRRVTINHADGETVSVAKERASDANFVLTTLPAGRELTSPSRPNEMGGLLAFVRFDDVKPAADVTLTGEPLSRVRLETFDGVVVNAQVHDVDGTVYYKFMSEVDSEAIAATNAARQKEADEAAAAAEEGTTPPKPELIDEAKIKEEVDGYNKLMAAWVYILPTFSKDRFTRRNEFYLAPLPTAEDAAAKAASEADGGEVPEVPVIRDVDSNTSPSVTQEQAAPAP